MVLAADYPLLEAFWTIALIALWALWIFLVVWTLMDNFQREDHSGMAKAGWTALIIFLPLLGILVYTIARPGDIGPMRGGRSDRPYEGPPTDALIRLTEMRDNGVLTEEEFQEQKKRLLA